MISTPGQPETLVEVIDLTPASGAVDEDMFAVEEGSADPATLEASQAVYSGWLKFDEAANTVRITGFETRRDPVGRQACRQQHDAIMQAFAAQPAARARILADQPVMFQSRICAANGEIVITCHGSDAVISPRRARPGSVCSRG